MAEITHRALWNRLRNDYVVNQSQQYAHWTLPYLMVPQLSVARTGRAMVERDFQEVGALLVNNLAAKLARILFPTQLPFFKIKPDRRFKEHAIKRGIKEVELQSQLARIETDAHERLFLNGGYAGLLLSLRYLIVTGNVLMYRDSASATVTAYGLQSFVVERDGRGNLMECVLREYTQVRSLPEDVQAALRRKSRTKYSRPEQQVERYTRISHRIDRGHAGYLVNEQIDDIPVGKSGWYPKGMCPWVVPVWNLIPGEHYGRGMVEDYAGGFANLSSLSESAALYGIEMMRVLHLVGNGSGGDIDRLATADMGEYVKGDPNQIGAHEAGDHQKLSVVEARIEASIARLSRAFMYTGNTRDAERVTMFELQQLAQEAEYTLGGVVSSLGGAWQLPLAHVLMVEASAEILPGIISGEMRPDVTAGIPAIGRNADVQNLLAAEQEFGAIVPILQADDRVSPERVHDMILDARSVQRDRIFRTPEELQAVRDAKDAQQQAMLNLQQAEVANKAGAQQPTLGA